MRLREHRLAFILAAASLAVVLLNAVWLPVLWRLGTFCIGLVAMFLCGHEWGRTRAPEPATADPRVQALDKLGIDGVYPEGPSETQKVGRRLGDAHAIQILAVTGERALANLRAILVKRLRNGCHITVLLATAGSDLVRESAEMQTLADIPLDPDGIDENIGLAEGKLLACLAEAANSLSPSESDRLGRIWLGHFNTQYRESMILCDRDWVWWTPPFDPARSDERPSFLAQGESSRFHELCYRHFHAVKRMCPVKELQLPADPPGTRPATPAPPEDEPWAVIRQKSTPVQQGWAEPPVALYAKGGSGQGELDASCTHWLTELLEDVATEVEDDEELVAWVEGRNRGVCVLVFATLADGESMSSEAQQALSDFVKRGGGLVATYEAIATDDHQTLRDILGSEDMPGEPRLAGRVHRDERGIDSYPEACPLLDDIPDYFSVDGQFLPILPGRLRRVRLLSIWGEDRTPYAAAWARLHPGKGRTVYLAVGSEAQAYTNPAVRRFLRNAIRWTGWFDERD